jgi:hypothetical protein
VRERETERHWNRVERERVEAVGERVDFCENGVGGVGSGLGLRVLGKYGDVLVIF